MAKDDSKTLAIFTHILGLLAYFIGPLVILLASSDEFVKKNAKNALNWQLTAIIYFIVSFILVFVLIGIPLLIAVGVLNVVFSIIAAVKASEGTAWRYPLSIPFFS